MAGSEIRVMLGDRCVGHLKAGPTPISLSLVYSPEWRATGFPLSPSLPLDGQYGVDVTTAFFQNALPEGSALDSLTTFAKLPESAVLELCLFIRNDLPGAIRLDNAELPSPSRKFREITPSEFIQRLDLLKSNPISIWDGKPRLSVAGVQSKLNLLRINDSYGFADGRNFCSDRILKFEDGRIPNLLLNEYLTLSLARKAGLNVTDANFITIGHHRSLEIIRFDRKVINENNSINVLRRHVIDGCQALGLFSKHKYERIYGNAGDGRFYSDGVSFSRLASIADFMSDPDAYRTQLLDWMIFNLLVGNSDAHGKNISFSRDSDGFNLCPWYDLINIRLCQGIDNSLAMSIGEECEFDNIHALQLLWEADNLSLSKSVVIEHLTNILTRVEASLDSVAIPDFATAEEIAFKEIWRKDIRQACEKWLSEAKELPFLEI